MRFQELKKKLEVPLDVKKRVLSATAVTCLGCEVDGVTGSIGVAKEKRRWLQTCIVYFLGQETGTYGQLAGLVGKLAFTYQFRRAWFCVLQDVYRLLPGYAGGHGCQ